MNIFICACNGDQTFMIRASNKAAAVRLAREASEELYGYEGDGWVAYTVDEYFDDDGEVIYTIDIGGVV